jgi:hypothetical protein
MNEFNEIEGGAIYKEIFYFKGGCFFNFFFNIEVSCLENISL